MNKIRFGLAMLVLFTMAATVSAAEFIAPAKDDSGNVTLGSTETHRNLYVAGGNVSVNGSTLGDLYAAGGMVSINGSVEQDLSLTGGNVSVNGTIGGDARIAGGNITINSPIGSDLLAAGGNISVSEASAIGADAALAGGNIVLDGPVTGTLRIGGGNVTINSKITGTVWVNANEQLTFGPKADVAGKVIYHGVKPAVVKDGAKVGSIEFTKIQRKGFHVGKLFGAGMIIKVLAMIAAALLLMHFLRGRVKDSMQFISSKPWKTLGVGFVGIIVLPIMVLILFVTFVGFYIALAILFWYFMALMVSALLGMIFFGAYLARLINKRSELELSWMNVVLGVVALEVISLIPILGWIACGIIFLMGFGSMLRIAHAEIVRNRQA